MYLVVKVHFMGKEKLCSYFSGTMVFEVLVGGSFKIKGLEMRIYKTIILPLVLYGCET
jgi:hypothetical protein